MASPYIQLTTHGSTEPDPGRQIIMMMTPDTTPTILTDVSRVVEVGDGFVPTYRETPDTGLSSAFVPDDAYAHAVAGMVIACADVMIVDPGTETEEPAVWLATRSILPMLGLWVLGGRIFRGELPAETVQRNFRRDTGLDLALDAFIEVPVMTRYFWKTRQQVPQDLGSDNLCYNFQVRLTSSQLAEVRLRPTEYDQEVGLQRYTRTQLKQLLADGQLHPVIYKVFSTIFGE